MKFNLFIDGSNIFLRSFFATIKGNVVFNSKGQDNSAIQVTLNSLFSLFKKIPIGNELDKIVLVLDRGGSRMHRQLLPDYKSKPASAAINRIDAEQKENSYRQSDIFKKIISTFPNSCILEIDNAEGDLVLSYAIIQNFLNEKNIIVTGDKDYVQLLQYYPRIMLYFLSNGWKDFITPQNFAEKLKLEGFETPYEYFFAKIMTGDGSDNIKGIDGMGWKRSAQFIKSIRENKPEKITTQFLTEKLQQQFKFLAKADSKDLLSVLERNTQLMNLSNFNLLSITNKTTINSLVKQDLIEKPFKGDIEKFKTIIEEEKLELKMENELMINKLFGKSFYGITK